ESLRLRAEIEEYEDGMERIDSVDEGHGQPETLSGAAGRRDGGAREEREAKKSASPRGYALGDGTPGAAQASAARGHEHAYGDGGCLHADHSAGQPLRKAPPPGGGVSLRGGGARLRPAPGLRRGDYRYIPLGAAGGGQALRVGGG